MPVGNLAGWHQVFAADFCYSVPLGHFPSAVSGTWGAYPDGWRDTTGNGVYDCSLVCSVSGGTLNLYLHTINGVHYVAAPFPKIPGTNAWNGGNYGMLYGRYEIRFRADSVAGYKTAWLLWPDDNLSPPNGEIDFPEGDLNAHICAFMHYEGTSGGQDVYCTPATYPAWHTAIIEWTPSAVTFMLDGSVIGVSTKDVPSTPMHLVLQTETSMDEPAPASGAAGTVHIAWVTVYRPS